MQGFGGFLLVVIALGAVAGVWKWRGPALYAIGLLISLLGVLIMSVARGAFHETTAAVLFCGGWIVAGLALVIDQLGKAPGAVAKGGSPNTSAVYMGVLTRKWTDGRVDAWIEGVGWQAFGSQAEAERFIDNRKDMHPKDNS